MSKEDLEYYFIQMLFHKNRMLLSYDNKDLYKALFDEYCSIYDQLPKDIDRISVLNRNFMDTITFKKEEENK